MPRLHNDYATLECRRTPWDERVFSVPCAEITHFQAEHEAAGHDVFHQFEAWAQAQGVQFAYGRFEPTRLVKQVVYQAGFYFAEASYCIRHHKLQGSEAFDRLIRPGPVLEPATEADHEELRTILATDFEHGRIHEDPWVAPAEGGGDWPAHTASRRREGGFGADRRQAQPCPIGRVTVGDGAAS